MTSHLRSIKFFEECGTPEEGGEGGKSLKIWEGYEHVMMKVGFDEEDDEKRQGVLEDMIAWLEERK